MTLTLSVSWTVKTIAILGDICTRTYVCIFLNLFHNEIRLLFIMFFSKIVPRVDRVYNRKSVGTRFFCHLNYTNLAFFGICINPKGCPPLTFINLQVFRGCPPLTLHQPKGFQGAHPLLFINFLWDTFIELSKYN